MSQPEAGGPDGAEGRNTAVACLGQACVSFCSNFVALLTPFYVEALGRLEGRPLQPAAAVVWSGAIIAASGLTEIAGSFLWAYLAGRVSVRFLYGRGVACHAVLMAVFAYLTDVRWLLLTRLAQGFLGGVSTIGLIIVAHSPSDARAARVGLFQGALTLGQVLGPLAAAMAGAALGFRAAFLLAAALLAALAAAAPLALSEMPGVSGRLPDGRAAGSGQAARGDGGMALVASLLLVLAAGCQITFLPALLPKVVAGLGVPPSRAQVVAGAVVAVYGAAAAAGAVFFGRLAGRTPPRRLLAATVVVASAAVLALGRARSVTAFAIARCLQTFAVSSVFPVVASAAAAQGGVALGAVNAVRLLSTSVGPAAAAAASAGLGGGAVYPVVG
ncbi:MAG: MFS transporter, partial [Acetobacteraceae bacterium]|nr:MFS transporter [Acetobacteraceae bacterium]